MIRFIGLVFAATLLCASGPASAGQREDAAAAYGRGDFTTAFGLWKGLAEQGDGSAQAMLGFLYHDGQGVPKNLVLADMWFHLAAADLPVNSQDSQDAWSAKALTEKEMTPAEIAEANDKAYRCQDQRYKGCD